VAEALRRRVRWTTRPKMVYRRGLVTTTERTDP
jgi:hypothetical protein